MAYDSPQQRDRSLERARRIKVGLVSAGVVGSLGFAGLAGWSTVSARYAAQQSVASGSIENEQDQSFSQWLANRLGGDDATGEDGDGSGDDGEQQLPSNQAPPELGPGTGGAPAHGSTGGS